MDRDTVAKVGPEYAMRHILRRIRTIARNEAVNRLMRAKGHDLPADLLEQEKAEAVESAGLESLAVELATGSGATSK